MSTAALDRARHNVARFFTDHCLLAHPSDDEPVLDYATGKLTAPDPILYYAGVCSVQATRGRGENRVEGDADVTVIDYILRLPFNVEGVRRGDLVTVTVADNPDLVDAQLVILRNDLRSRRVTVMVPCVDRHHEDPLP